MSNKLTNSPELEQRIDREIEQKFAPIFPEKLLKLRERALPIQQYYLSHPSEPFSLRFREELRDGELLYTATLKDRGSHTESGLDRVEVEIPVTAALYRYYQPSTPQLLKLRSEVNDHVSVDFYEDGHIQVESERPNAWRQFIEDFGGDFVDMTGDRQFDNEWRAHFTYRRENDGREALAPLPELDINQMTQAILETSLTSGTSFVRICGRSGSGKSTIVRQLQGRLREYHRDAIVVSTDDYHRGATWLRNYNHGMEWTEWDHPVVYDTKSMALDLEKLSRGESIEKRYIDFSDAEPRIDGYITPAPVVLIEGIYADSADFNQFDTLRYEMPTPLATCIGRRLLRDLAERPEFADPATSLRYMLEQAEPMYRQQINARSA